MPKASLHVKPQKSFSSSQADENERRWSKEQYDSKNKQSGNHYDWSRRDINFAVIRKDGKNSLIPLTEIDKPLHEKLKTRLDELNFKAYKEDASNDPNSCIDVVFGGDHDRMAELAFGDQEVAFDLSKDNGHIKRNALIEQWASDVYDFACKEWGAENIMGMEVHLDETTPHAHLLFVPVAERKKRGRCKSGEERKIETAVSYCGLLGKTKGARGKYLSNLHTRFFQEVGSKYGLERGDVIADLPEEEQRERIHKNKHVLEAERLAKANVAVKQQEEKELDESIRGKKSIVAELDNDIENKENNKELLQMDVNYLTDERSKLQVEETELKQSIGQLSPIKEGKEQTIAVIKELGSKAIDTISGKSKREKEGLKKQLRDEKKQHASDVAGLKSLHENAVAELKAQHEDAIAKLKNKHKTELGKAKDELREEKKEHVKTQKALDKALADNSQDELKRKLKETQNGLATARRNETVAKNKKADSEKTLRSKEMEHEDYMWLIDTCAKHNLPSNVIRPLIEGKEVDAEVHGETRRLKFQRRKFYNTTASLLVKVKDIWQDFMSWYRRVAEQMKSRPSVSIADTRKKGFGIG